MDGPTGTASAAGPSMTAAQTQSKTGIASGVVSTVSDAPPGLDKSGTAGVQTLNGSTVLVNCHVSGSSSVDTGGGGEPQPAVSTVNNGPVTASNDSSAVLSTAPSAITRTSPASAENTVISSHQAAQSVPTVTLARPPMQTPSSASQSLTTSTAVCVSSPTGSAASKVDSAKTIIQSGGHVATSPAATVRSPTVLQTLRTSTPSTMTSTPAGAIRAVTQQVLAPRVTQPQTNSTNIQNIQLPPGKFLLKELWRFPRFIENVPLLPVCKPDVSFVMAGEERDDVVLNLSGEWIYGLLK